MHRSKICRFLQFSCYRAECGEEMPIQKESAIDCCGYGNAIAGDHVCLYYRRAGFLSPRESTVAPLTNCFHRLSAETLLGDDFIIARALLVQKLFGVALLPAHRLRCSEQRTHDLPRVHRCINQ